MGSKSPRVSAFREVGLLDDEPSIPPPGIYVFNTSSLQWVNQFTAISSSKDNPFSQQLSQRAKSGPDTGLQGSYGYAVPPVVYSSIGGNEFGGATITAPVATATAGPLATGKPITYTVTGPNGAIITETGISTSSPSQKHGANVGAAIAGAFAGLLFLVALYLAFCALLYRKQLALYKRHVALTAAAGEDGTYRPQMGEYQAPPQTGGRFAWLVGMRKESTEGSSNLGHSSTGGHSGNRMSDEGGASGYVPGHTPSNSVGGGGGNPYRYSQAAGVGSVHGSQEDLLAGFEPSYWGVLLHPRRSLRVINR